MESMVPPPPDEAVFQLNDPIHFVEGLPAFEMVKEFVLVSNEEEAPFLWLQAASSPNLAFITIDPFLVFPDYRPDIRDSDVEALEIDTEQDTFILSIVNISNTSQHGITSNLVSPIVINWKKRLGKQVILQNHLDYAVNYRIDGT